MNYNRGQNKMEPPTAIPPSPPPPHPRQIKDEAAQTPKHAIFPSLPGERGKGNLVPRAFPLKKWVGRDAPPIF